MYSSVAVLGDCLIEVLDTGNLVECKIIERISRFSVLVEVNNEKVQAYINNTGRLEQYLVRGKIGYLIKSSSKLNYRLIGIEDQGFAALLDTRLQERVFEKLVESNTLPWLRNHVVIKRYPRVQGRVFDFLLRSSERDLLVELKSAVLRLSNYTAGYPDAPTKRGRDQLITLGDLVSRNLYKGLVVFISGLPGIRAFQLYCGADKLIEHVVEYALSRGVFFKSISLYLDPSRGKIVLENPDLPVILKCTE